MILTDRYAIFRSLGTQVSILFSLRGKPQSKTDNEDECAKTVHKDEPYRGVNLRCVRPMPMLTIIPKTYS